MSDNVVQVQPKQRSFNHRRHKVTITYVPESGQWYWEFEYLVRRSLHGYADSIAKAEKDAKKWIEEVAHKSKTV